MKIWLGPQRGKSVNDLDDESRRSLATWVTQLLEQGDPARDWGRACLGRVLSTK